MPTVSADGLSFPG